MSEYSEDTQLAALLGPEAKFSGHKKGERIKFREGGQTKEEVILWVRAPSPAIPGWESPSCNLRG